MTLNKDFKEKSFTVHIIHHNDLDGICAAAVVNRFYAGLVPAFRGDQPDLTFQETNYNRPADTSRMSTGDRVVIVDFSYPPEEMQKIENAIGYFLPDEITWLDHHKTAAGYGYEYSGLRDFADKGLSGCELAWRYYFPNEMMPVAVRLIGDYDSWRLQIPDSKVFYEGAKTVLHDPLSPFWPELLDGRERIVEEIISRGRTAIEYRNTYAGMIRKSYGYETRLVQIRAYAMNLYGFGSQQFGPMFESYPIVIAYIHDGDKYIVSLYSRGDIDVGEIAQALGGGGHRGAAGFVCDRLPFTPMIGTTLATG